MQKFYRCVAVAGSVLDRVAGAGIVIVMLLVVANILLRTLLGRPILGTYEYVGFFTAAIIGFSLANCALHKGHIAIEIVVERMPGRIRAVTEALVNTISLLFLLVVSWKLSSYAAGIVASGQVSTTTQTPFHPFVYMVALGLFLLALVMIGRVINSVRKVIGI